MCDFSNFVVQTQSFAALLSCISRRSSRFGLPNDGWSTGRSTAVRISHHSALLRAAQMYSCRPSCMLQSKWGPLPPKHHHFTMLCSGENAPWLTSLLQIWKVFRHYGACMHLAGHRSGDCNLGQGPKLYYWLFTGSSLRTRQYTCRIDSRPLLQSVLQFEFWKRNLRALQKWYAPKRSSGAENTNKMLARPQKPAVGNQQLWKLQH